MRRAEAAQTAEVAEEINRSRQGFVSTARISRRQQAASRREEELADGHAEMRWAGLCADLGAQRRRAGARRVRGRARRPARPPWPAAPLRRAGRGLPLHPAALPGAAVRAAPGRAPRARAAPPPTSRPPTPSSARARSAPPAPTSAATPTAAPGAMTPGSSTRATSPGPTCSCSAASAPRKSSLVKTYLYRQAVFGRQAWVLDPKGEYGPLAEALGVKPIALAPGGEVRLNPLSPRGGREAQLGLLRSVCQAALRRELSPEEDAGLRVALESVDEDRARPSRPCRWSSTRCCTRARRWCRASRRPAPRTSPRPTAPRRSPCNASARATCAGCSTGRPPRASTSTRRSSSSTSARCATPRRWGS